MSVNTLFIIFTRMKAADNLLAASSLTLIKFGYIIICL